MESSSGRLSWKADEARAALSRYEGTVRAVARRLSPVARFGHALDEDDLWAEGRIAVLEALRTYAGFGIEERTWVRTRVKQRMIDAIRRLDVRTRSEVRRAGALSRLAPDEEPPASMRPPSVRRLISFDATANAEAEVSERAAGQGAALLPADEHLERSDQCDRLLRALEGLPPRQRKAIELGLFQGFSLREIGAQMEISESRVCQLQKRAVQQLQRVVSGTPSVDADAA